MDEVKPAARLPTVEHREPCKSRGSRTVLGAPGGEIPPGDSSATDHLSPLRRQPAPGIERRSDPPLTKYRKERRIGIGRSVYARQLGTVSNSMLANTVA